VKEERNEGRKEGRKKERTGEKETKIIVKGSILKNSCC